MEHRHNYRPPYGGDDEAEKTGGRGLAIAVLIAGGAALVTGIALLLRGMF